MQRIEFSKLCDLELYAYRMSIVNEIEKNIKMDDVYKKIRVEDDLIILVRYKDLFEIIKEEARDE